MIETIQAERVTLYDLIDKFNLKLSENAAFFREWQDNLPEINQGEKQQLHRVKENYFNLAMRPMVEYVIKMVVVSPLLDLAGFYLPPFYTTAESSIEIEERDKRLIIRGIIDVLVLQYRFWVLVIESKRSGFSLEVGIPQCLAYMLGSYHPDKSLFGMVINGSNFIFLKLVKREQFEYALSDEFSLRRGDDLVTVSAILKGLKMEILS